MAESILVTGKKISSMELVTNVTGSEKIPTGQPDDLAITPDQIADHTILRGDLASQEDLSQVEVSLGTQITDLENDVASADNSIRGLIAAEEAARIAADNLKVDKEGSVSSVAGRVGDVVLAPSDVLVEGFGSQAEINKYVPKPFLVGYTYGLGERVILNGGEIVESTVDGNVSDPNGGMSGWVLIPNMTFAEYVLNESGETQQQVNYSGGVRWHLREGGYQQGERVVLANGTTVKSVINGNMVNPNSEMEGWVDVMDATFVVDGDKNQHQINSDLRITTRSLRDFGANPSKPDNSAEIQAALAWSVETGGKVVGTTGDVYLINKRNFPLEGNIFKFAGDIDFDGQFCTFKLSDGFGDYQAFGYREAGDFRFKNVIIDENTTNNPLTRPQSDQQNKRTALFLWGAKNNNTCEIDNIIFKDWCGIWQITTNNFSRGHVKGCKLFSSQASVTWIDRTSMYIAIHGAEISGNKFYGMGNNIATTPMESHASGQVIKDNYAIGYRNSLYLVNDPVDTLSATYEDVIVRDNKFINTAKGICIWNTFTGRNVKNLKILDNTVTLNSHLSTNAFSYPVQFGIGSLYGGWLGTRLDDVDIIGNEVEFVLNAEDAANDSTVCHGIQLNCYGANAYYGRNNRIKGNTIKGAFRHGIFMDFVAGNQADSYLQLLEIKDNTIIDCAVLLNGASAIRFVNVKNPRAIKIADNTAIDTRSSPRMLNVASISLTSGKGHIVSKGNELKYLNSTNSAVFNYNQDAGVYQEADRITINPYNQESPTHYAAEGSTVFDTVANVTWHQVGAGVSNKWIVKVSSDDLILNTYVTAGSEAKPLNPSSLISNWVATRNGYTFKPWKASTAYSLGEHVNSNGQAFRCTQAGTSGTVAIGFSVGEITDGTCKWVMIAGLAALWTPHYKKSRQVTIQDSTATDVAGLNAVINSLLAQLRD